MSWLSIEMNGNQTYFSPGQKIEGSARWHLEKAPENLEVRLLWFTQGKGTQDVGLVESIPVDRPLEEGSFSFSFKLPDGPYSFSGKLISLLWAVEVVTKPSDEAQRADIVVAPNGREIVLPST